MSKELKNSAIIVGISIIMRIIMGILASRYSAPYIETDLYKAGDIYHMWDIGGQAILALGVGVAFWKSYIAPTAFTLSIVQFGKVASIYFKDATIYNFNEAFFFINLFTWCIYTTFSWKFKDFSSWYYPCIILHIILGYLFLLLKPYI